MQMMESSKISSVRFMEALAASPEDVLPQQTPWIERLYDVSVTERLVTKKRLYDLYTRWASESGSALMVVSGTTNPSRHAYSDPQRRLRSRRSVCEQRGSSSEPHWRRRGKPRMRPRFLLQRTS